MSFRKFGFELEFDTGGISLNKLFHTTENVLELIGAEHEARKSKESWRFWTIKKDISCGSEISSPVLISDKPDLDLVRDFSQFLSEYLKVFLNTNKFEKCISHRCGFHVHVDVSDFNDFQISNLIKIFYVFERHIYRLNLGRIENSFTKRLESLFEYEEIDETDFNYYSALDEKCSCVSLNRFLQRGTIEFRHARMTLDSEFIHNWIVLILSLVEISKKTKRFKKLSAKKHTVSQLCRFIANNKIENHILESQKVEIIKWIKRRSEDQLKWIKRFPKDPLYNSLIARYERTFKELYPHESSREI